MEIDVELATFCDLEWPRLVGSLTLYTGDRDLAEELTQEALIRVCEHWPQVREAESASAWAHRVGFNLAKSQFRRRAALRRIRRLETAQPDAWDPDTASHVALREAVAALPDPQRSALVLRYFADLSVREVASLMACPTNTVKTHTRRALMALRNAGFTADPDAEPRCLAPEGTP
jgi:RNA polymerase sigma factor (sigma-70 family)